MSMLKRAVNLIKIPKPKGLNVTTLVLVCTNQIREEEKGGGEIVTRERERESGEAGTTFAFTHLFSASPQHHENHEVNPRKTQKRSDAEG
jgi:hypothetical protein